MEHHQKEDQIQLLEKYKIHTKTKKLVQKETIERAKTKKI